MHHRRGVRRGSGGSTKALHTYFRRNGLDLRWRRVVRLLISSVQRLSQRPLTRAQIPPEGVVSDSLQGSALRCAALTLIVTVVAVLGLFSASATAAPGWSGYLSYSGSWDQSGTTNTGESFRNSGSEHAIILLDGQLLAPVSDGESIQT